MQFILNGHVVSPRNLLEDSSCAIFGILEARGDMNVPLWERSDQGIDPLTNSRLTGVNFLTAADEADDDRPIPMAVETGDQEFGFRLVEIGPLLFAVHEVGGLFSVPCSLGLVEKGDMFDGRTR